MSATLGIDERFARDDAAYGRTCFLADALGSTVGLVDASQTVRQSYSYEPYGEVSATGSSNNPYQYTGRENDGTGLYYYRARYYSPSLKRFISEDPMGLAAGLNSYAYVDGNPLGDVDPLGLETGWVTEHYQMDMSHITPCDINAAFEFYANLVPFVGVGIDFAKGGLSDVAGGLGSTFEGARMAAESNAASEAARARALQKAGMYNRQQRLAGEAADAGRSAAKMLRPITHSLGVLSLGWNLHEYYENSKKCGCDQ